MKENKRAGFGEGGKGMPTFQSDTRSRTLRQWIVGLAVRVAGRTRAPFGVTLFLLSTLGSDPFTVLVQGISSLTGLGIGTCHVGMLVLLLIVMLIFTRGYVKPGSFVCAFCGGWIIDFFLWVLSGRLGENSPLWLRIICMVAGCIILAFGMSLVMASRSGTGPNDLVSMILSDKIGSRIHLQFRWVRLLCAAVFGGLGWALGGVVGVGTVVAVLLVGPVVQFFLPLSSRIANVCIRDGGADPDAGGKSEKTGEQQEHSSEENGQEVPALGDLETDHSKEEQGSDGNHSADSAAKGE